MASFDFYQDRLGRIVRKAIKDACVPVDYIKAEPLHRQFNPAIARD